MSKQETMHRAWAETTKRFNSAKKKRITRVVKNYEDCALTFLE